MRVILEFDLETERSLYDDVLALQKYYRDQEGIVELVGRTLTPNEQRIFSCEPGSAAEGYKATVLLKIWEDDAEKEGKLESVLEDLVEWLNHPPYWDGSITERAFSEVKGALRSFLKKRKVDVKIEGLEEVL